MREEIYSKLEDLKKYVQFLRSYQSHRKEELREDYTLRGAVERYLQLALECTLDIGEMIISKEGFRKPALKSDLCLNLTWLPYLLTLCI